MKNKKIWKIFGIALFVTFVLTWIIPSTTIGSTGLVTGSITPTGFADIFSTFDIITYYFAKPSILILLVGAFYGIINKTGAFKAFVKKVASIFEEKGWIFVVITAVFYSITTALSGMYLPMIMFIPLSIAILLELKYNKLDAILSTVGASTVGLLAMINSTVISSMTSAAENSFLWIKVGLLVVLTALIILYILFVSKKKYANAKSVDSEVIFMPENRSSKIKYQPKYIGLLIVVILLFVVSVLGFTNWNDSIDTVFNDVYTFIKEISIGNFAIFDKVLGYFETFGSWTYASLYPTIGLACIIMAFVGRLKFSETMDAVAEGMSKFAGMALLAALINIILIFTLNSGFIATIMNLFLAKENVALITISNLVGNLFMVSETYSAQYIISIVYYALNQPEKMELYGAICQFTFGFVSLVAPTSILLMLGLYYTDTEYKNWFKYVWKLLLAIFVAILIAVLISALI